MLMRPVHQNRQSAHVVVLGNEKGGSGKSTTALHIVVALLKAGQRVATIDLDSRQKSFTHYIENRRDWANRSGAPLEVPPHICVERGETGSVDANEAREFASFSRAIASSEHTQDVVIVDTPVTTHI
jgi:chromosome partitioning protein